MARFRSKPLPKGNHHMYAAQSHGKPDNFGAQAVCPCGKMGYYNRAEAKKVSQRYSARPGATDKMRVYKCPESMYFHLTGQPASQRSWYKDRGIR